MEGNAARLRPTPTIILRPAGVVTMRARDDRHEPPQDPVGIVIARGRSDDAPPRFSAFVWGPVPEAELDAATAATTAKTKAA